MTSMADSLRPAEVASLLLKCSPLVILILFGGPETLPNNYPPSSSGPYWTLLDVAQLVLLIVSAGLAVTKSFWALKTFDAPGCWSSPVLQDITADLAMALSLILIALLLHLRWRRSLPPSAFAVTLLGVLFTACALDAFGRFTTAVRLQDIRLSTSDIDSRSVVGSFLLAATVAGNFITSQLQDLLLKRPNQTKEQDEDTFSLLSRQACVTLFPLMKEALRKGSTAGSAPLPVLRRGMQCSRLVQAITARLKRHRIRSGERRKFLKTMMKVLWVDFLRSALCTGAYYACLFARIPALELVINSVDGANLTTAVLLFTATTTMEFLVSCYQMDVVHTFGCRTRSMFLGLIFKKVTAMSAGSKARYPAGHVTSLISVDCSILGSTAITIPTPLFGVAFLPFIIWMLAVRTGVGPSLCCAAWLMLVLSLPFLSSFFQKLLWSGAIRARDERLKATTDLLSTIRVVKMYAWEDAMQENVLRAREAELKWLHRINLLDSILDSIYSSSSSVVRTL